MFINFEELVLSYGSENLETFMIEVYLYCCLPVHSLSLNTVGIRSKARTTPDV